MKEQKIKLWQKTILMVLVLVMPISGLMISWYNTNHRVTSTPPFVQQQNFWRDSSNENTRFGLDELQNKFADLNAVSRTSTTQEEFEQSMWQMLVEMQSQYNEGIWRELDSDNVVDFVNYQTEELRNEVDSSYIDTIKQGLEKEGEDASYFFDNYLNGEPTQFAPDVESNQRIALVAVPGLASGAWTTMNVALNTAYYTVKAAGWWIPAFITAGIVLVALAVVTAVIVLNWDVIRPVFNNIVNQFLSIAGKVASWVRDFFNGALGNAQAALTQVIDGVKYVIDVVLTTATVAQMQKSGYYFLVLRSKDNKMYFNPIWVTQKIAIEALKLDLKSIGTYTLIEDDANNIARQASDDGMVRLSKDGIEEGEEHSDLGKGLYFLHYHPSTREHAHSWFGAPIWS